MPSAGSRARQLRDRGRAAEARARRPAAGGQTRVDRLPRPAGHVHRAQLRRRRDGQLRRRGGARQVVVVGATAPSLQDLLATSTSGDGQMSRAGDPGGGDRHRAATASRCDDAPAGSTSLLASLVWPPSRRWSRCRFGALVGAARRACSRRSRTSSRAQLAFNDGPSLDRRAAAGRRRVVGLRRHAAWSPPRASHPLVNRVLDRAQPARRGNQRTRRLRALLLLGAALVVVVVGARLAGRPTRCAAARPRRRSTRASTSAAAEAAAEGRRARRRSTTRRSTQLPGRTWPFDRDCHARGDPQPRPRPARR